MDNYLEHRFTKRNRTWRECSRGDLPRCSKALDFLGVRGHMHKSVPFKHILDALYISYWYTYLSLNGLTNKHAKIENLGGRGHISDQSGARLRFFSWLKALCELVFVVFCDLIGACHNSLTKWWGGFIEGSNDQLAANTSASSRKICQVALQIYFEIFQSRCWLCKASDRIVPTTVSRMFLLFLPRLSCIQEKKPSCLFFSDFSGQTFSPG